MSSAPKNFTDQAIILKRLNYSEADRIVTLFTKKHGKLTAIAKGVRKTTSRKAPHIEPFSHANLYFVRTRGMPIITQAETISIFPHIRNSLTTTRYAFHLTEVIDKLMAEEQAHPEVFLDLISILNILDTTNQLTETRQQHTVTHFHLKLLSQLGFGLPQNDNPDTVTDFIETIIERRLTAKDTLI